MLQSIASLLVDDPIAVLVAAVLIGTVFLQLRETRLLRKKVNDLTYQVSELKMLVRTI
jgi:hypothetical protein